MQAALCVGGRTSLQPSSVSCRRLAGQTDSMIGTLLTVCAQRLQQNCPCQTSGPCQTLPTVWTKWNAQSAPGLGWLKYIIQFILPCTSYYYHCLFIVVQLTLKLSCFSGMKSSLFYFTLSEKIQTASLRGYLFPPCLWADLPLNSCCVSKKSILAASKWVAGLYKQPLKAWGKWQEYEIRLLQACQWNKHIYQINMCVCVCCVLVWWCIKNATMPLCSFVVAIFLSLGFF